MSVIVEQKIDDDLQFALYDPKTDDVVDHTYAEYKDKFLVLFFYPADFTFVCPTELKDLNTVVDDLKQVDAEVLVVSTDTVFTHKRWVETEKLLEGFDISMVSDRKGDLSRYFGVLNAQTGNSERGTFIISPNGIVKSVEVVTEPIGRSSNELVRKVRALHFVENNPGHACPASWNTGGVTLQPGVKVAGRVGEMLDKN